MKKNVRINVVLNAKRDTSKVVENYKGLFSSNDRMLFYTHDKEKNVKSILAEKLGMTDEEYSKRVYFTEHSELDYKRMGDDFEKSIIIIKMPSSLFYNISQALNETLKFVDSTTAARFVHFFADDFKLINEDEYDPALCEEYMDKFSEPFIMDGKTNRQNFAFSKMAPRFVFAASVLKQPVSFFQFEGHDHFIIDRDNCKDNFDEKVMKLYLIEFIIRLHKSGKLPNLTFYTDPTLTSVLERDAEFPPHQLSSKEREQVGKDSKYMHDILNYDFAAESSVDPIIERLAAVLDKMSSTQTDTAADAILPEGGSNGNPS